MIIKTFKKMLLVLLVALLSACAQQGKLREAELGRIIEWLPGIYSNDLQVNADVENVVPDVHEPLDMVIIPVAAPFVGKTVFYVEQTDAMNIRRQVSQQLVSFETSADKKSLVQYRYTFKEPDRWARGHKRPDIFRSVVSDDLVAAKGCELTWKQDGNTFKGENKPASCRVQSATAKAAVDLQLQMELEEQELRIAQRELNDAGALVSGRPAGDFFRFRKTGKE